MHHGRFEQKSARDTNDVIGITGVFYKFLHVMLLAMMMMR